MNNRLHALTMFLVFAYASAQAQTDDLLSLIDEDENRAEYVTSAFKSSRVVNNHSMEMIGSGVLDLRILHRFGLINSGIKELFGLDQASFRLGFDYGLTKNLTIGLGRSTYLKELDGMVKWRIIQQSTGEKSMPVSVLWISGITVNTLSDPPGEDQTSTVNRTGYYHEVIIGRKFSPAFSLQLNPIVVHRNNITPDSEKEGNDVYSLGVGFRLKISNRIAVIGDYNYLISGLDAETHKAPLGIGFDIETGGHVFQLHFSNSIGMNENAFITRTSNRWGKGEINFGFNLSRVFSVKKKKI